MYKRTKKARIWSIIMILQDYQRLVGVKIIQKTQVNIFIQVSEKVSWLGNDGRLQNNLGSQNKSLEICGLYLSVINSVYNITWAECSIAVCKYINETFKTQN